MRPQGCDDDFEVRPSSRRRQTTCCRARAYPLCLARWARCLPSPPRCARPRRRSRARRHGSGFSRCTARRSPICATPPAEAASSDRVRHALADARKGLEALADATNAPIPDALRNELRTSASSLKDLANVPRQTLQSSVQPVLVLLERVRPYIAGDVGPGLTFEGSYSQSKPKEPVYGGHASAMGPAPAPVSAADDGRPVPVDLRRGRTPDREELLRRSDKGSHPRVRLRRRRAVRLRRRRTARHLSRHRGRAVAGSRRESRIGTCSIAISAAGSSRMSRSRPASTWQRGEAARASATWTAMAGSIST